LDNAQHHGQLRANALSALFNHAIDSHGSIFNLDLPGQPQHWPPKDARGLRRCKTSSVIERLPTEHDHVHATNLLNCRGKDTGSALRVNVFKGRIGNKDGVIRTHGEGVLERLLGGFRPDAQRRDRATLGFLLLKRALHRVLIEWINN
jgi:hypothetical protein